MLLAQRGLLKTLIYADSIREAVTNGKLVELSSDYRTAGAVRATLPLDTSYAATPAAFNAHIRGGVLTELGLRIDAFCRDLGKAIQAHTHGTTSDFIITHIGRDGQARYHALKLNWLAASRSWVVSLPDEEVRLRAALF
jgi:hypothetical protein